MSNKLDIVSCRSLRPYSRSEYIGRVLWGFMTPFFRWSPRTFFGWRRMLLRIFGAEIGKSVHIYPSVRIYLPWNLIVGDQASIGEWTLIYNLGHVTIGEKATISHNSHLCAGTHDYRDLTLPLLRLPIEIGAQSWVCSNVYIGPNVKIGEGSIVGAGSVVVKSVPAWQIVAGNPVKFLKMRKMKKKAK